MSKEEREKLLERLLIEAVYVCPTCSKRWGIQSASCAILGYVRDRKEITCPECYREQVNKNYPIPSSEICLDE